MRPKYSGLTPESSRLAPECSDKLPQHSDAIVTWRVHVPNTWYNFSVCCCALTFASAGLSCSIHRSYNVTFEPVYYASLCIRYIFMTMMMSIRLTNS